jgi:hypothetical protein
LQTLLHLRRESLLLRDSRDEFHSCHHPKGDDATREGKQLLGQFYTFMQKALQKLLGDTPPSLQGRFTKEALRLALEEEQRRY